MNTLTASSLVLAAFAFAAACAPPAPPPERLSDDTDESEQREETKSPSEPAADDKDDEGDTSADPREAPRPVNTSTKPASADAGAPTKPTPTDKGDAGKGAAPNPAACMTACQALSKCTNKSFCTTYCAESPEVITCLAKRPACAKADFIACEDEGAEESDEPGEKAGGK